ncbi:hypothetical protein EV426DRAFT_711743 [Tirmania nivea]|nr:hypothetical protein EV426DRAFT_711743 [Tirmania nivea]
MDGVEDHLRLTGEAITKRNFLPHFREARKAAYTSKNIKSAFETTGIHPFNPRRILGKYTGTAAADPKPSIIPAMRHLHQQVREHLKNIDDPILQALVDKLANAAIGGLTTGFLGENRAMQLEVVLAAKVEEAKQARKRTRLTTSKAITGADLLKLHLEQQACSASNTEDAKKTTHRLGETCLIHSPNQA